MSGVRMARWFRGVLIGEGCFKWGTDPGPGMRKNFKNSCAFKSGARQCEARSDCATAHNAPCARRFCGMPLASSKLGGTSCASQQSLEDVCRQLDVDHRVGACARDTCGAHASEYGARTSTLLRCCHPLSSSHPSFSQASPPKASPSGSSSTVPTS